MVNVERLAWALGMILTQAYGVDVTVKVERSNDDSSNSGGSHIGDLPDVARHFVTD